MINAGPTGHRLITSTRTIIIQTTNGSMVVVAAADHQLAGAAISGPPISTRSRHDSDESLKKSGRINRCHRTRWWWITTGMADPSRLSAMGRRLRRNAVETTRRSTRTWTVCSFGLEAKKDPCRVDKAASARRLSTTLGARHRRPT